MQKKILIMGGNGFIGLNTANYLDKKNIQLGIYAKEKKQNFITHIGNIIDDNNLENIISNYDSIMYLINPNHFYIGINKPENCYKEIQLLIKVLDSCINTNCNQIIFASSGGTVYGNATEPLKEDTTICNPISHYGISKLTCEKILLLYNKIYGMNNIILRISNPYGKGQDPNSNVGVITKFTYNILNNQPIDLYGNTTRDFIDINTVSEVFYNSLDFNNKSIIPIFNVGSGEKIKIKEIINLIEETVNKKAIINEFNKREYDVETNVLDMTKTSQFLNIKKSNNEKEKIKKYVLELKKEYYE